MPEYVRALQGALASLSVDHVSSVLSTLSQVRAHHGTLYICGNGGSAANASHAALHFQQAGISSIAIDSMPFSTAVSNDHGYANVFADRLATASSLDCLMVISGSGRSPNIVVAVAAAKARGLEVVCLLGMGGGYLASEPGLVVDSEDYGTVEDCHSAVIHILAAGLAYPGVKGASHRTS